MKFFCCLSVCVLAFLTTWQPVYAHAGERGFIMLLPTRELMVAGTSIVVLTFLAATQLPTERVRKILNAKVTVVRWQTVWPQRIGSGVALLFYLLLIATGFFGSPDPLDNPVGPVVWSWFWIGFVILHVLFGNIWSVVNPFTALDRLVCGVLPAARSRSDSPEFALRLNGYWPAVLLLIAMTWFENISLSPYDPVNLATVMLGYLAFNLVCMRLFGRENWLRHGELFGVYFSMVSRLAPLTWRRPDLPGSNGWQIILRCPWSGLLEMGKLPRSGVAFVLVALACVTFDGASHTFWWLGLNDINPLEFAGRSSVMWPNSIGLIAACLLLTAAYYLAILSARPGRDLLSALGARLVVSLIPIAFGYHFAHYLPAFLLESQYGLRAVSDPFALGWNLFGTADLQVIASVRTAFDSISLVWYAQTGLIVLSHVVSVVIAHLLVFEQTGSNRKATRVQVPFAVLMIGYTFLGLWLLSAPSL